MRVTDRDSLIREAAALGWDTAVKAMRYDDGTPVEIVRMVNPFRAESDADGV